MPYKTTEAIRKKSRDRMQRARDRRSNLLAVFTCIACKESDPDIIDWHHVDPDNKESKIKGPSISEDLWWLEVLKCVPLCCNCHRKIHKDKLCLLPINL